MNEFLLTANAVSGLATNTPQPRVTTFLTTDDALWLSTIVLHELPHKKAPRQGRRPLPPTRQGAVIEQGRLAPGTRL